MRSFGPVLHVHQHAMMTRRYRRQRHGGVIVLMAILLPVVLLLAAFTINLAYMELTRTELQIVTDASCRAAGKTFAKTGSQTEAILAAQEVARRNTVAGSTLPIEPSDLVFGFASRSGVDQHYSFEPNIAPFNAVHIRADSLVPEGSRLALPMLYGSESIQFRPTQLATCAQVELDVCLIVDRSGSMAYGSDETADPFRNPMRAPVGWTWGQPVPPQSRWSEARSAVSAFLDVLKSTPQQEYVGLATYNHNTFAELPLSNNYSPILGRLDAYSAAFEAGGTNIGGGIIEGVNVIQYSPERRNWSVKVAIVLTDGIHNWGTSPWDGAYYASWQDVVLYTVTFSNEADQNFMRDVASIGAGQHFHATNQAELVTAFESIARSLPLLLTQ